VGAFTIYVQCDSPTRQSAIAADAFSMQLLAALNPNGERRAIMKDAEKAKTYRALEGLWALI